MIFFIFCIEDGVGKKSRGELLRRYCFFSVSGKRLYQRLCPSVALFVSLFVASIHGHKSKSAKMNVLDACVCGRGVEFGWGFDVPAHPSNDIVTPRHWLNQKDGKIE